MDTDDSLSTAVVVGDDGGAVLKKVSSTLEKAGFLVVTGPTGKAALDRCRAEHRVVDLAVIDTGAPGVKPLEVAERLQEMSPHVRLLFLSDGAECFPEAPGHIQRFLRKPFRTSRFLGRVLEMMEQPVALGA